MTNSNTLIELLGEPRTSFISTWNIVATPSLALNLAQLDDEQKANSTEESVHAVVTDEGTAFAVGGFAYLFANLDEHQERYIKCTAYDPPHNQDLKEPWWLRRALEGHMRLRLECDPFVWDYIKEFEGSDWQIAQQVKEPLRLVKRVRLLKSGLTQRKMKVPETWDQVLRLAANKAPDLLGPRLLAEYDLLEAFRHGS